MYLSTDYWIVNVLAANIVYLILCKILDMANSNCLIIKPAVYVAIDKYIYAF